jgi:protein-S-isoprenylcysteine O-methyltransferase Ste14
MLRPAARFPPPWQDVAVARPHYRLFGLLAHLLAVLPMVYFVGFLANLAVPKSVDSGAVGAPARALAVDLALLLAFAAVHSALARPAAKRLVTRWIPAALERSHYSAVAGAQIVALMALWQPLPVAVWSVGPAPARVAIWALYALGWAIVLWALWAIDERRLFGLRRAWAAAADRDDAVPALVPRGPYRFVRHPLYSATILSLFAAPDMSQGRLLLAVVLGAYTLVGARFEESALEREHGAAFRAYRAAVPAYLPSPRRRLPA